MGFNEEIKVIITAKDNATSAINRVGKSLKGLSATATAVAGVLAGVFVYKTVSAFGDFDQAMRNSMAIMGDVSDSMKKQLIDKAREVARTMAVSHKEVAESYYYLASAGLTAEESLKAMPKVARLAEASQLDMATATDIAVNSLRAFGLAVEDLSHVNDVLVGTVTATNTNMVQLAEAMKYVAPVAHSVGWSIEDVSSAIGILANQGIKGSQAGTGLRRMLSELLNPTDRAKDALDRLGISMSELDPRTHSLTQILRRLKEAGADASDVMLIFGDRGGQVALALMDNVDAVDKLNGKLKEMDGITEKIAKEQEGGLNSQLKILKNNFNDLAITIGQQLAPTITKLANKLKELAQDDKTVKFAKELGEGMASAFMAMADAFMAVANVMDRLPPGFGQLIGKLIAVTAVLAPLIAGLAFLAQALGTLWPVVSAVGSAVGSLAGAFGGLSAIAGAVSYALGSVGIALGALAGAISLPIILIGALIAVIVALVFNIGGARDKVIAFGHALYDGFVVAVNKAKEALGKLANKIRPALSGAVTTVKSYGSRLLNAGKTLGRKIVDGVKNGLANIKNTVANKLKDVITAVQEIPGKVKAKAIEIGHAIVDGIKNGLSGLASALKDALLSPLQSAVDEAKDLLGIGSPSKVFAEIGKNVVEGYVLGVKKMAREMTPELPPVKIPPQPATVGAFTTTQPTNVNITLNGVAIRDDTDIDRLADAIEEKLSRRLAW